VISDIDGTITKSDVLGHLLTRIGKDWTHQGIAKLYKGINLNGYEFIYLSSRPIGQADATKQYIQGILQDKEHKLPNGPVILSPDRALKSFKREIILRKPYVRFIELTFIQIFKIQAL
jgi:phosphatidate phosphatase LPIN